MILTGAIIFSIFPTFVYAQYYYQNGYPYYYSQPIIRTINATNITSSSATLNGSVTGYNISNTYNFSMWFEYGRNANFGYSTFRNSFNSGYPNYSSNIASLDANTVYYFRAVAQGPQGIIYGNTTSFITSFPTITNINTENNNLSNPSVTTNPATSISNRSVKLNSFIINSINNPFTTWFEWGTTPALGNISPMTALGALPSAKHINTITELAPGTTYYFRAVAQNPFSRINGATFSFTTSNAISQINAVEKTEKNTTEINTSKENKVNTNILESAESAFGANLIGAGSFLPVNIFGWLLLTILILALVLLAEYLYHDLFGKKSKQKHS